ncbi:MAG: helix-turn-helix transcriptional regulator [Planctomycetes bacterium]|nr:helix-turn-helix transcriptional regulator [Planctomycetota bacterium]MCD7896404.1 helix-turn-helix transcriptional regulator [Planctomycetaceae bacterium]
MENDVGRQCPVEYTLSQISGKWRIKILKELSQGPVRYGVIGRSIHGISPKVLIHHLREMEEDGLVLRTVYPEVPPRVEYSLTRAGGSVFSMLSTLRDWGLAAGTEQRVECRHCEKCVPRNYQWLDDADA